jgi:hypothetical protein
MVSMTQTEELKKMDSINTENLEGFHFRDLNPSLCIGTTSDRLASPMRKPIRQPIPSMP